MRASVLWVALTVLAGCDQVLGLHREQPDCGTGVTVLDLDFEEEDVEACEPWGDSFSADGTTVTQRRGVLQVTPRGTGAAGCVSRDSFRFPRGGLIAEVPQVVSTSGAYTSLNPAWRTRSR